MGAAESGPTILAETQQEALYSKQMGHDQCAGSAPTALLTLGNQQSLRHLHPTSDLREMPVRQMQTLSREGLEKVKCHHY